MRRLARNAKYHIGSHWQLKEHSMHCSLILVIRFPISYDVTWAGTVAGWRGPGNLDMGSNTQKPHLCVKAP